MRLLDTETQELKEFMDDVPTYAILSHTWGGDEVTLQDLARQPKEATKDFAKIDGACNLAFGDGYRYIWIDTCCIDKTSSAELSEAINSMFRWYEEASVCYVYLSDLSTTQDDLSKDSLAACRWFQRGWTLQELVAPAEVHFYDCAWNQVGTKTTLLDWVADITSIPQEVLLNPDEIYCLSVATKMSWAAMRKTTRVEDMAYCLLGLFDVHMPLLYGEGRKAFRRLQEAVLKKTDDLSLLAWSPDGPPKKEEIREIWARTPAEFSWIVRGKVRIEVRGQFNNQIEISSKGVRVARGLMKIPGVCYVLDLRCEAVPKPREFSQGIPDQDDDIYTSVGIRLRKFGPFMFVRDVGGPPNKRLVFDNEECDGWMPVKPYHPVWLQAEERFLPFWILDDPSLLPQRRFYREFRNYNSEPDIHFVRGQSLFASGAGVEAILPDLWDEPRRTLLMGWDTAARYRPFRVTITYQPRHVGFNRFQSISVEIFVVIHLHWRGNPVFLVDPEDAVGQELERAATAVSESKEYPWEFFSPAPWLVDKSYMGPGRDTEVVELLMREWVVTARVQDTTVPGISEKRPITCIDFDIQRRQGDGM
ncbi:heterokaryon incompatibility protein-domain-containing protein [Podospora conica]|nr:heterokaryon incompatibility protein-domain-containing protein [Schizothecium conicum]